MWVCHSRSALPVCCLSAAFESFAGVATDCNSMRRDMTSSLRACLAAESWKRLWPDENRGGNTKAKVKKLTFEEFAQSSFKVNQLYAEQALAILNFSPELLEDAKKASRSTRAAEMVKAGTHTQAEAAREVGISEPAVHKELTKKVKPEKVKTKTPVIGLSQNPALTAKNIKAKMGEEYAVRLKGELRRRWVLAVIVHR